MTRRVLTALLLSVAACGASGLADPEVGDYEGVAYDEQYPGSQLDLGKEDFPPYEVPADLPELVDPEVIVSTGGLTVHLFDRASGFQRVYPAGVGVLGSSGRSITPAGHFATGASVADGWWYVERRTMPAYFAGLPFLRITARNSRGQSTYGLHGPITAELIRGYVSHGCVRMAERDIIELFWLVRRHASTPLTIQHEVERDAAGAEVDLDTAPVLWAVGETIAYGASAGPRP